MRRDSTYTYTHRPYTLHTNNKQTRKAKGTYGVRKARVHNQGLEREIFVIIFSFFRVAFMRPGSTGQAMFAPVWPLVKIVLKSLGRKHTENLTNPDSAPVGLAVTSLAGTISGFQYRRR